MSGEELCFFCGQEVSKSTVVFTHEFDSCVHIRCLFGHAIKSLRDGVIDAELKCILNEFGISMHDIYKARRSLLFPNTNRGGLSPSEVWIDDEVPAPDAKIEGNEFMGYTVTPLADPAEFIRKYQSQSRVWRKACEGSATVSKEEAEQMMKKYDEFFVKYVMDMPPTVGNFNPPESPGITTNDMVKNALDKMAARYEDPTQRVREVWMLPDAYLEMRHWVEKQNASILGDLQYRSDRFLQPKSFTVFGVLIEEKSRLPEPSLLMALQLHSDKDQNMFHPIIQDGKYVGLMFNVEPRGVLPEEWFK